LANVLAAEIGEISRFAGEKRLASYSLLAPVADDTGEPSRDQTPKGRHLSHQGNRTLKWAFIEAGHGAVRSGGKWRELFDRVTNHGKKDRGRGYIKVARQLVKVVYAVWKHETVYTTTPPARPGQKQNTLGTRSGTGQPLHPMVPA
jgi:transposase